MAYTIPYTDEANKGTINVEDNTINQQTSVKLPGRNTTAYGTAIAENFLHLLENFAATSAPSNPVEGQLWYDSTLGVEQLKVFDGTNWVSAGGLKKAQTAPEANQSLLGDLWVDTDNQQLYLFSGSGWVLVGPEFSQGLVTGVTADIVVGTDDQNYSILLVQIAANTMAIVSTNSFTPKIKIPGFTVINPGFNLSANNISGSGVSKYYGIAEKAENLIINNNTVAAGNFLRGDTTSNTSYPINIRNNVGINYGINAELNIGVSGNTGVIQHNVAGSSIDVKVKNDGLSQTVIRIDSDLQVGINNLAPAEALDVTGNILSSGTVSSNSTENAISLNSGAIKTLGGLSVSQDVYIGGKLTVLAETKTNNVVPDQSNFRDVGAKTLPYANIYATKFVGNLEGNVSGTVSGRAGSADKLTSPTTFRITGDVSADDIVFDGQTGTSIKNFQTTISNEIVATKPNILVSQADDEFLFNRVTGNTGLKKISRQNLLAAVPILPVGSIVPYAGLSAPVNWLLCDGAEVLISDYTALFDIIGRTYKAIPQTGYFALPDLRGRFALGADNMGGNSANINTTIAADTIGAVGGASSVTLQKNNLPDHKHNLRGDSGDQYYAVRDLPGTPNDLEAVLYDAPTATGAGQALPNSGSILTDTALAQPFDVINPFLTMNYIIYAGQG